MAAVADETTYHAGDPAKGPAPGAAAAADGDKNGGVAAGSVDLERRSLSDDAESTVSSAQEGVKRIEAVAMSWSKWGLICAYIG